MGSFDANSILFTDTNTAYLGGFPSGVYFPDSTITITAEVSWNTADDGIGIRKLKMNVVVREAVGDPIYIRGDYTKTVAASGTTGTKTISISIPTFSTLSMVSGKGYRFLVNLDGEYDDQWGGTWIGTGTIAQNFTIYSYASPTIPSFLINRCLEDGTNDDNGTRMEATVQYSTSSVGALNEPKLKIYRKRTTETEWTLDKELSVSGYSGVVGPEVTTLTYDVDKRYEVKAELADNLNVVANTKAILPSFCLGEVDAEGHQESFMGRLDERSPANGNDFHGPVLFRNAVAFDDPAAARTALGVPTICSGTIPSISLAADALTTVDVSFPVGLFSSVPDVNATIKYGMGYSANNLVLVAIDPTETTETKARFRLMRRGGATTIALSWIASEMP